MMDHRQSPSVYPANLSNLLSASAFQQTVSAISVAEQRYNADGFVDNQDRFAENQDRFADNQDRSCSTPASLDDADSNQSYGVDLSGKTTNLGGKSFTIAAILGLSNAEEDVMNLRVQNQRQIESYLYSGQELQRINEGFCRSMVGVPSNLRQDSRSDLRTQTAQLKPGRGHHALTCNSSSGRSKRIRTIFTPEQLERLEAEFERQQYMVGPERLYLAHALQLTEAQVKVWFQNRRIKWRKHHLEVTQQRLAVLQRHRPDERDDDI